MRVSLAQIGLAEIAVVQKIGELDVAARQLSFGDSNIKFHNQPGD
jgi:hypothetical protein